VATTSIIGKSKHGYIIVAADVIGQATYGHIALAYVILANLAAQRGGANGHVAISLLKVRSKSANGGVPAAGNVESKCAGTNRHVTVSRLVE